MDTTSAPPPVSITPQTRVGELLTRWPQAADILVQAGLTPLADPAHREMVKSIPVTIGMACASHGLDLDAVLKRLRTELHT